MYQALPIGVEVGILLEDLLAALDPNKDYYSTHDIIAALPHSKLSYLGNGAFGVAASAYLSDGREIVIKLAGIGDDGYPWWAEYCKDNPSRHLPEVYHTARIGSIHMTAMKRYEPLGHYQEEAVQLARDGYATNYPSLAATITRVRDMIRELKGGVDMHLGNYMCDRETGEIVITDPCSYMPPAGGTVSAPRQLVMNFEIDNMGTAIHSLLGALRKAEEQHGEEQPDSMAGKWGKVLHRHALPLQNLPKDHLFGMNFAEIEARVIQQWHGKVDDEFLNFVQNKWGNL